MRCFLFVAPILLPAALSMAAQGSAIPLRDGQQVTLTGRLTMEPGGHLQFVTVKTTSAYVPIFQGAPGEKESEGEVLHEIGLAGYSDYSLLYAHRGQQVTVVGKLATDSATPYFWHGTRLRVNSIRLADGGDLLGAHPAALNLIAADAGTYQASLTLPTDLAAPWAYSADGKPAREGQFLSCSSNGGGDVVNCYCAQGFHALQVQSSRSGVREKGDVVLGGTAQVQVGEDAAEVRITVTCSR